MQSCQFLRARGPWLCLFLVLAGAFEFTPLDLWLQDPFFDFASRRWLVDGREPVGRLLFYNGPKVLLIAFALGLIALTTGPESWRRRVEAWGWITHRPRLAITLLVAASIPVTVGALKNTSDVFCPSELVRYGGTAPHRRPFSMELCTEGKGHCWPAGHASGGFALLSLTLLAARESLKRRMVLLAMAAGWSMGLYQMLKGSHFMSHTVVTMLLALVITTVVERVVFGNGSTLRILGLSSRYKETQP